MNSKQEITSREFDTSGFRMDFECYNNIEYCAYKLEPEFRNCESCSLSHYFHDCNGNPIND